MSARKSGPSCTVSLTGDPRRASCTVNVTRYPPSARSTSPATMNGAWKSCEICRLRASGTPRRVGNPSSNRRCANWLGATASKKSSAERSSSSAVGAAYVSQASSSPSPGPASKGKSAARLRNSVFGMTRSTVSPSSVSTDTAVVAAPRSRPPNRRNRAIAATARFAGIPTFSVSGTSSRPRRPWNHASMATLGTRRRSAVMTTRVQCGERRNSSTRNPVNSMSAHDPPA